MVVGTIVVCVGLIAFGSIVQVGATLWAGSQVTLLIKKDEQRDIQTENMRKTIIEFSRSQAAVLRTVCLNVSHSDKDRADCLIPSPEISSKGSDH